MDIPHILVFSSEVLGAVTAIGGTFAAIYKFCVKPIIQHFKEIHTQFSKLDTIYAELQPNSGSSLRDAINQIRNTLHTVDKRQRALLSYEDNGIFEADANGHCIWVNRAFLKMINATFEEVQGNGWKNFIHPQNREYVFDEWTQAVEEKRDCKMNVKYLSATDEDICTTFEAFAAKNECGKLTGYICVVTIHNTLDKCQ